MKVCFVMRGLPGSSRDQVAELLSDRLKAVSISADSYFTEKAINFDVNQLPQAHDFCWAKFKDLISKKMDVIVNNSNVKSFHYAHYLDFARRNGYEVFILSVPHPNPKDAAKKAGIPESTIRKMMVDWEENKM